MVGPRPRLAGRLAEHELGVAATASAISLRVSLRPSVGRVGRAGISRSP